MGLYSDDVASGIPLFDRNGKATVATTTVAVAVDGAVEITLAKEESVAVAAVAGALADLLETDVILGPLDEDGRNVP